MVLEKLPLKFALFLLGGMVINVSSAHADVESGIGQCQSIWGDALTGCQDGLKQQGPTTTLPVIGGSLIGTSNSYAKYCLCVADLRLSACISNSNFDGTRGPSPSESISSEFNNCVFQAVANPTSDDGQPVIGLPQGGPGPDLPPPIPPAPDAPPPVEQVPPVPPAPDAPPPAPPSGPRTASF